MFKEEGESYRLKGYELQKKGDLNGALSYYVKSLHMQPDSVEIYNDLGVIYEAFGEEDKALDMYEKAVEIDPNYLPTYTNLAFMYERKADLKKANYYWKKRYELGEEGEYWREVSRQHLIDLGMYPEVEKEMMKAKACSLAYDISMDREKRKAEAKIHFDIANRAFLEGDYGLALKELTKVFSLNFKDEELSSKAFGLYESSKAFYLKKQASVSAKTALEYLEDNDYSSAEDKLNNALSIISDIAQ